jgi:Raf kinase inhibitor-like YbhB/YbcL family protein
MKRALLVVVFLAACRGGGGTKPTSRAMTITSSAFAPGGVIPVRYSCDGAGARPPFAWTGTPAGTSEIAVSITDPDVPSGTFYHWVVLGLPATAAGLDDGAGLPAQARQATSSSGRAGYVPVCPPRGAGAHHYHFTVYALARADSLPEGVPADRAVTDLQQMATARGELVATFQR